MSENLTLDNIRLVELNMSCRSEFCKSFRKYNLATGEIFQLSCKSWRCEKCRDGWRRKWSYLISDVLSAKKTENLLLVNLTTSAMISHENLEAALRLFIKEFRACFGRCEYVKVVEYNKRKTQPHFHLIVWFYNRVVPQKPKNWPDKLAFPESWWRMISAMWCRAVYAYRPDLKPSTVTWCQPPRGNGSAAAYYAVGYITGGNGHSKDEEPDGTWRGRKLTYSKRFFPYKTDEKWQAFLNSLYPDRLSAKKTTEFVFSPVHYSLLSAAAFEQGQEFARWLNNGGNKKPPNGEIVSELKIVSRETGQELLLTNRFERVTVKR